MNHMKALQELRNPWFALWMLPSVVSEPFILFAQFWNQEFYISQHPLLMIGGSFYCAHLIVKFLRRFDNISSAKIWPEFIFYISPFFGASIMLHKQIADFILTASING